MSNFKLSPAFREHLSTSSLNYRESALHEIVTLIIHDSDTLRDHYLASALYYGATELDILNMVY